MKDYFVNNKGFVSTYFLIIFMFTFIFISIITTKLSYDLKTLNNIEKYNMFFNNEYTVISFFKNKLDDNDLEGEYFINNHNVVVSYEGNQLVLEVVGSFNEIIYLQINDNKIFDYYAYRDIDELFLD